MNTYQKIIQLERTLFEDYKAPNNNAEYNKALENVINALKTVQKYY